MTRSGRDSRRWRRGARGELLTDDSERQELVALEPEDRAEPLDVGGGVEPVSTGGSARREQLLVLGGGDLRDRYVGELALELLHDGADRERLWPGAPVPSDARLRRRRG